MSDTEGTERGTSRVRGLPLLLAAAGLLLIPVGLIVVFLAATDGGTERPLTTIPPRVGPGGSIPAHQLAGTWTIQAGEHSAVGYRMEEELLSVTMPNTAEGTTPAVEGGGAIDGDGNLLGVAVNADLRQLRSDDPDRDESLRTMGLETDRYPTASFSLTGRIPLPSPITQGAQTAMTLPGELTLHGATRPVSFEVKGTLAVNVEWIDLEGEAQIVLADFGIEPPDVAGVVRVADRGTVTVRLRLVRDESGTAGAPGIGSTGTPGSPPPASTPVTR